MNHGFMLSGYPKRRGAGDLSSVSVISASSVHRLKFCTVTLASVIPSLEKGMWFTALDMKGT